MKHKIVDASNTRSVKLPANCATEGRTAQRAHCAKGEPAGQKAKSGGGDPEADTEPSTECTKRHATRKAAKCTALLFTPMGTFCRHDLMDSDAGAQDHQSPSDPGQCRTNPPPER